jgi:hypothetical protein
MRRFRRTFRCSDVFPATVGEEILIRDGRGHMVELWRIEIGSQSKGQARNHFRALITEYEPVDNSCL